MSATFKEEILRLAQDDSLRLSLAQAKSVMHCARGLVSVLQPDDDADLDFAGRDHVDIDAVVRQRLEHLSRDAGMRAHADADNRELRNAIGGFHIARADFLYNGLKRLSRFGRFVGGDGETDVRESLLP